MSIVDDSAATVEAFAGLAAAGTEDATNKRWIVLFREGRDGAAWTAVGDTISAVSPEEAIERACRVEVTSTGKSFPEGMFAVLPWTPTGFRLSLVRTSLQAGAV